MERTCERSEKQSEDEGLNLFFSKTLRVLDVLTDVTEQRRQERSCAPGTALYFRKSAEHKASAHLQYGTIIVCITTDSIGGGLCCLFDCTDRTAQQWRRPASTGSGSQQIHSRLRPF